MDGYKVLNKDGGLVAALLMRLVLPVIIYVSESGGQFLLQNVKPFVIPEIVIYESSQISSFVMQCYQDK